MDWHLDASNLLLLFLDRVIFIRDKKEQVEDRDG
jgi:hypothetical protein